MESFPSLILGFNLSVVLGWIYTAGFLLLSAYAFRMLGLALALLWKSRQGGADNARREFARYSDLLGE